MKDIMNMKLKKKLDFKDLPKSSLKTPKLKTSLPYNKGIKNIISITNGKPLGLGMSKHLGSNLKFKDLDTKDMYSFKNKNSTSIYKLKPKQTIKHNLRTSSTLNPMRNKNFPLPTMGRTRISQQKGLKPWGDYDGDKVINMLDCNPRNKKLQGPENTLEDKLSPSDELRRDYEVLESDTGEEAILVNKPEPEPISESVMLDDKQEQEQDLQEKERLKELDRRRKELESLDVQEKQKRIALLRRQQQEQEMDLKKRRKELLELEKKKKVLGTTSKAKQAIQPITKGLSTISQVSKGFGGFGVSQQGILGATSNASQYKLLVALGKAPPLQQVQQQQVSNIRQAQAQPETEVVSPYSKRKVSYVRGPYKK